MKASRLKPTSDNTTSQSQIRAFVWAGNHTQAIRLATQELDNPHLPVSLRMDLLDLRAESYIAFGKFDLAMEDTEAMITISRGGKDKCLQAQALNRLTLIQIRKGDIKGAINSASSAVKIKHSSQGVRAASLYYLSYAQMEGLQNEAALKNAEQAIALFQSIGNFSGAGRTYWVITYVYFNTRKETEGYRAAQTSLDLCKQAGDQYGIGNAYNVLSAIQADIAERMKYSRQALQAFQTAGYIDRQNTALANLATLYSELGLYVHAYRLTSKTMKRNREIGVLSNLVYELANLFSFELSIGRLASARQHLEEFAGLVTKIGNLDAIAFLKSSRGELAFEMGDTKAAIKFYKSALKFAREKKLPRAIVFLTQLGKFYLRDQNLIAALEATTQATALHRAQNFAKPEGFTSQAIWWHHAQALDANKKPKEAREALKFAYELMLAQIASIRDIGLRRNALNKVEANREAIQFWVKDGTKRKLPKERLFAHLYIESNTREPFARLTDTSQRLNLLKEISEIQTFLVEEAMELSGAERVILILEDGKKLKVVESILPVEEEAGAVLASIKRHLIRARLTRAVQLILPKKRGCSRIIAPLIAQNKIFGYLYADMDSIYGLFDEIDRDMLGMLTNQTAVTLDNAGLATGIELVYKDHLTGIFNRRYFDEKLQKLLEDATKDKATLSLLHIDVDNFKHINDTYGHQTGDKALKIIANCMKNNSRKHDLVCRIGGDEFALVLVDVPEKAALLRGEKLCEEIRRHTVGNTKKQTALTASIGVANFPQQATTPSELFEFTDIALYQAKADGRNCARAFKRPA